MALIEAVGQEQVLEFACLVRESDTNRPAFADALARRLPGGLR